MPASPPAASAGVDPRYPVGRFQRPTTIGEADRAAAIQAIASLPGQLRGAVSGWTDTQLNTPYREEGWTVRQLIHHIADSHMQVMTRLRKALTEENPTIQPYDEKLWAELPDEKALPVELSLAILEGLHGRWVYLLEQLAPEQWQRTFQHPETGQWTVDAATMLYAWHSRHHLAHVTELARARGW